MRAIQIENISLIWMSPLEICLFYTRGGGMNIYGWGVDKCQFAIVENVWCQECGVCLVLRFEDDFNKSYWLGCVWGMMHIAHSCSYMKQTHTWNLKVPRIFNMTTISTWRWITWAELYHTMCGIRIMWYDTVSLPLFANGHVKPTRNICSGKGFFKLLYKFSLLIC